jgi:hypothetical protein
MALTGSGRQLLRGLALAGVAGAGYVFGITSDPVSAQPAPGTLPPSVAPGGAVRPGTPPPAQPLPLPEPDKRVVAYLYGNVPVTREELGDFLIARGGYEKLELLVNKKIIEIEAARRGITVTPVEIRAGLEEDVRGLGINLKDFEKHVLPRYGKSLYEWVEDVIKPRLLLTKMCRDRVKVSEDDLKNLYENKYGERRQSKVICWNKEDLRAAQSQWAEASKGDVEFDRIARTQADKTLGAACGLVAPIGRHSEAADKTVEKVLFNLKVGELSQLFDTEAGIMCIKLHAVLPPDATMPFDEKMKTTLRNELFAKRLEMEIPKYFQELKAAAKPNLLLKGAPSAAEFREGVNQIVNQAVNPAGGVPPGAAPGPMPMGPAPAPMK